MMAAFQLAVLVQLPPLRLVHVPLAAWVEITEAQLASATRSKNGRTGFILARIISNTWVVRKIRNQKPRRRVGALPGTVRDVCGSSSIVPWRKYRAVC